MIKIDQYANTVDWLLESDNPSVRYLTLVDILGKPREDDEVARARRLIMRTGVAPKILAKQKEEGYWESLKDFYARTKYRGTVWTLIALAELLADARGKRIRKACEIILERSQEKEHGGFAYRGRKQGEGGDPNSIIPCLTGNMLFCLIRFGYYEDPRVQKGIDWIVKYQRFDDAEGKAPRGYPYGGFERCWGRHTCYLGVVKSFKALSEIPKEKRSDQVKNTMQQCAEYILKHRIYKRSHNLGQIANERWRRLGFPLMWDTDILEMLLLLRKEGYDDRRMSDALALLKKKMDSSGRWKLEKTYDGRMQVNIEKKGEPSKWITLRALTVLRKYG